MAEAAKAVGLIPDEVRSAVRVLTFLRNATVKRSDEATVREHEARFPRELEEWEKGDRAEFPSTPDDMIGFS
jgi:hypothetical protein